MIDAGDKHIQTQKEDMEYMDHSIILETKLS